MWVFTRYGFYSAIKKQGQVHVRARLASHLEALKRRFAVKAKIHKSTDADYKFRMLVEPAEWARLAEALADELDYSNFKSEVLRNQGHTPYEEALHKVWATMHKLQK